MSDKPQWRVVWHERDRGACFNKRARNFADHTEAVDFLQQCKDHPGIYYWPHMWNIEVLQAYEKNRR